MLTFCTWLWGSKYSLSDVARLKAGIKRHLKQPHRFMLMTERERTMFHIEDVERHAIKDPQLTTIQGCFCRLRMFDRGWQIKRKIEDRLVCMDLDVVITGKLDSLFDRKEPFVILAGANSVNPCPFNGSVMMLRPGYHHEVWASFSIEEANKLPYFEFPDDQGWIAHKIPDAATWKVGASGIYAFKKPGWPAGNALPSDARIVAFPGKRSPGQFTNLTWVRENWIE
jgi:hypothetical protein